MADYCDNNIAVKCTKSELREIQYVFEERLVNWPIAMEEISFLGNFITCFTRYSPTPWEEGSIHELSSLYPGAVFFYRAIIEAAGSEPSAWFCNGIEGTKKTIETVHKKTVLQECERFLKATSKSAEGLFYQIDVIPGGRIASDGESRFGECSTYTWKNIKAVSCGNYHTVGLKEDGTLIACGSNVNGQCDVEDLEDKAVQVSCGRYHTAILLRNGRVVVKGKLEDAAKGDLVDGEFRLIDMSYPVIKNVEGMQFSNRFEHIEHVKDGEKLTLVADRKNKYYRPVAIEVFNSRKESLGYLQDSPRQPLSELAKAIKKLEATVESVTPLSARRKNAKYPLLTIRIENLAPKKDEKIALPAFEKVSVSSWTDIVKIKSVYDAVIGMQADGKILSDGNFADADVDFIKNMLSC